MNKDLFISDILVLLDHLGMKVDFKEGTGPIISYDNLENIIYKDDRDSNLDSLSNIYDAIKIVSNELQKRNKPLLGFCGAPWTLATYAIEKKITKDHSKIRAFAYKHGSLMDCLIDKLTETIVTHLINQIESGVNAIQIFDTHANNTDFVLYNKYCVNKIKIIAKKLKKNIQIYQLFYFLKASLT